MTRAGLHRALHLSIAGAALGLLAASGCGSTSAAKAGPAPCTPGERYYCRCADRSEGSWLCKDDHTFDACEPCEDDLTYPPDDIPDDPPPDTEPFDAGPTARCGDGIVQQNEDCDDGNTNDADGCDAQCQLAGTSPPATRTCPGLDVHVWEAKIAAYVGWTTGSTNTGSLSSPCAGAGKATGAGASDRVFHVTAHAAGTLHVKTQKTTFDNLLYATSDCKSRSQGEGDNDALACADATSTTGPEALAVPVSSGQAVTVFVDGVGTAAGNFTVEFSLE